MGQILVPEIFQGALDGLAGGLAQTAQSGLADGGGQLLQEVQVLQRTLVVDDAGENLQHPAGALPAGDALAAGLILGEVHEEPGYLHHAGVLIHDHQTAGADHGPQLFQGVEVQWHVQVLLGETAAGGTADLNSLELFAVLDAAADVEDDFPQGGPHGDLDEAGVHHVARQGEGLGARGLLSADGLEPGGSLADNQGDGGEGLHVVQHGGLSPQAMLHRPGRFYAGHTPVALDGGGESGALAADKGPRAPVDVEVEGEAGTQDVVAQQVHLLRLGDGGFQPADRQGVLGADVDIALVASGGDGGDEHTLNDGVGVALHNGAVHKGAGVALVAVAHHVLFALGLLAHAVPLPSGGEAAAPPAPEAGVHDLLADGLVGHLEEGLLKGRVAVLGQILVDILGVGGAAVLQHDAVLTVVEGDVAVLGVAHSVQLVEQALHHLALHDGLFDDLVAVLQLDVGIEDALRLDLDQGAHLAEAVAAALLQVDAVPLGFGDILGLALLGEAHVDVQPPAGALLLKVVVQLQRAAGDTAGAGAQQNLPLLIGQGPLGLHPADLQTFTVHFRHWRRPPFSGSPAGRWPAPGSSWSGPGR